MKQLNDLAENMISSGRQLQDIVRQNESLRIAAATVKDYLSTRHTCEGSPDVFTCQACWIQTRLNDGIAGNLYP